MSLDDTLIAVVRLACDLPSLDVKIADRSSRWVADSAAVTIRVLGFRRLGVDEQRLTQTAPTADMTETIHGVRVLRTEILVDTYSHANADSAEDLADRIRTGLQRSDVETLLDAENLAAPTCGDVRTAPYRGENADTRSVAIFAADFNAARAVVASTLVPWIETAPGEATPGPYYGGEP